VHAESTLWFRHNVYHKRLLLYAHSNSQPVSLRLKCSIVVSVLRRSCGSLFQIVGPHRWKLRQPNRVDRARGMMRSPWSADRNRERAATVCTGVCTSPKYFGHRPREQSNIISAILKMMRCDIGMESVTQCRCAVLVASDTGDQPRGSMQG